MRGDYNVLTWEVGHDSPIDDLRERFIDGGHDGVYIRVPRGLELEYLDFLTQLPGLKYVEVNGSVLDDSHAFSLPVVEELVLLTRSQAPVRAPMSESLVSLGVDDRPGALFFSGLTRIQRLTVWSFAREEFGFLTGIPTLEKLKVEGLGQVVDLSGIESCRSLVDVELLGIRVKGLAPLRNLKSLHRLWLIGPSGAGAATTLNLDEISEMRFLNELRITNSGSVQSVEPLLGMPELKDIRLRGTMILDPNSDALQLLSRSARVVGPSE